ncbi:low affinity immunoglobulin gamma Fc region receptor II-like [Channa argus]|uniref:low affinity immunoglobulin gamma Fc region receptor II-like n=1 Tax=Channa argus TaxID=215402 RepID=UPI003521CB62
MEVRALCFTDWMFLNFLLIPHVQSKKDDFLIITDTLQYFEYESVTFHCVGLHGSTQLKWIRNHRNIVSPCDTSVKSCTIVEAYETDSGEYWCETEREKSSTVNITVTAGPVTLESPVLPLMEGETMILRCRSKNRSTKFTAVFYKDGVLVGTGSSEKMIIHSVRKRHEGLYTCNITGVGESAGSWLTVRARHRDACPFSDHSLYVVIILRTVFTIVLVPLLLLLVGLLHCGKLGAPQKNSAER